MSNVCIIETGGTMGELRHFSDGVLTPGIKTTLVPLMIKESNEIVPKDWVIMAEKVVENCKKDYDGIVLTHGTDTLAYTSIALSFMIRDLNIPVAITGSMIHGAMEGTDAVSNLRSSITFVAQSNMAEVCIIFSDSTSNSEAVIIRGSRGRKISSKRINAFGSVNSPILGYVGGERVQLNEKLVLRKRSYSKPYLAPKLNTEVAFIKYHPALGAARLQQILGSAAGCVIEAYGEGQIRTSDKATVSALSRFKGPIVVTSQCDDGGIDLKPGTVEADRILLSLANIIPVRDMPPETALIKLMWVLGNGWNPYELMAENICGEIMSQGYECP